MILNNINLEQIFRGVIKTNNKTFSTFVRKSFGAIQTKKLDIR